LKICEIDWDLLLNILKSISIIIASLMAVYGINSWRRETKWKRKYELAEEVLSLFYEVQELISIIRSPFGNANEGQSRKRGKNESLEESEILDRAYTVIERFEKNKEPFNKLRSIKYRFITVFGKKSEKPFNDIIKLTNKIMAVSNLLGDRYWKEQGRRKFTEVQLDKHLQEMHEYESIIWEGYHENSDEIKNEILRVIDEIENICKQVICEK
jgi:hypothetical protein